MNDDELIAFNPILADAFARFVDKDPLNNGMMTEIVAASVKGGIPPEKIYALIKTGRILTADNMQFLSEVDVQEWQDAAEESRGQPGQSCFFLRDAMRSVAD